MLTAEKLRTNRRNALLSTGPRTAEGLARSAQNAVKGGLFARALVLPALGESADELDRFRTDVAADLGAVGVVEGELAVRVAGLLWRLRRVARAEVAALTVPGAELPPHQDDVVPLEGDLGLRSVPLGATAAYRLAHVRAQLLGADQLLAERHRANAALGPGPEPKEPVDWGAAHRVLRAAAAERGWISCPTRWEPVLVAAGCRHGDCNRVRWTVGRLRRVLRCAAADPGGEPGRFLGTVRRRLRAELAELGRLTVERRRLEAELAGAVLAEREAAAAARVCSDDALVQRIARAESHLSRDLDRALALLARIQSARRAGSTAVPDEFGFVLQSCEPRLTGPDLRQPEGPG